MARRTLRPRGAGHGSRGRPPKPRADRAADPPDLAEIEPHARELGSERELEGILEILARGSSSTASSGSTANRDIVEVAREIADATEALPVPA